MEPDAAFVTVEPLGVVLEVRRAESLMAAAVRSGYSWPTRCRGVAICTMCAVEVRVGADNIEPPGPREAEALSTLDSERMPRRLACQMRVTGDVAVVKEGVVRVDEVAPTGYPFAF